MKQTTIPMKPDARVTVKCNEDLSVEGNDSSTLVIIVEQGDSLRMREENGVIRIMSDADCRLLLPGSVTVTIEKTGGDCNLINLNGRVIIGKIGGDLKMEKVGGASVESVGGDCLIRNATGAVELARIGDTLTADDVHEILAGSVGDDVRLSNVHGKVDVTAGDDVHISVSEVSIPEIRATAGSDIRLFLPKSANCQLKLTSGGEDIELHVGDQDVELQDHEFGIPIGNGGAMVVLTAGDSIRVTDQESPDWGDDHVIWDSDQWKDFGLNIAEKVKEGLKTAGASVEFALHQAESAGRQASQQVERAIRDLDERGFHGEHRRKVVGFAVNSEKTPPASAKAGPSDEERMLVLKMLQDKKITVEEAEKLLNALDR